MKKLLQKLLPLTLLVAFTINFQLEGGIISPASSACSIAGTASASSDSVCYNVSVTLSLSGYLGSIFQWQSFDGTNWINETGLGSNTDSYDVSLVATTQFRAIVTEPSCPSDTSNTVTIVVGTIGTPTSSNVSRCGPGFVNLTASGNGTLQWYTDATTMVPFATGSPVNTFIPASTTLYVADQVLGGSGASSPIIITEIEVQTNDILEIQNVGPLPVDVTGWKVAVNNSYTDINLVNPIVQVLSGIMQPGDIIQFSDLATGPGTYWGNNILWNAGAFPTFSGWALIVDDQNNPKDFVVMNWPDANIQAMSVLIGGVPVTPGVIWNGNGCDITNTGAGLSLQRNGSIDNDNSSDFTDQSTSHGVTNPLMTLPFTGFGCNSARVPVQVTISPSDPITINASATGFCLSGSATLTAMSSNSNYSYTWSPPTGLNTTSGATVVSTPPGPGTITYIVMGDDGLCSNVDTVSISVGAPTMAGTASTFQDTICLGKNTDLILSGSVGDIQWQSFSGGNWINETNPGFDSPSYNVSPTVNTTYRAYVSSGSCPPDSSNIIDITVLNISDPITTDSTVCGGGVVTLYATGQGTLSWYTSPIGGAAVNGGNSLTFSTTQTTVYYVESLIGSEYNIGALNSSIGIQSSTAGNNTGMAFDVIRPVTIDYVHIYPSASGTITINLRQTAGGPILASYTQAVTALTGKTAIPVGFSVPVGTGYRMEMAAGSVTCQQNTSGAVYPYTAPLGPLNITGYYNPNLGTAGIYLYFYDWIVTEGCRSNRVPATAFVTPFPPIPSISQSFNILTSSAPSGNQWYLNGVLIPGATDQTLIITQLGNYTVQVTSNGCSTMSGIFQVTVIGLNELPESLVSVYPNPVSHTLNIDLSNTGERFNHFIISDMTGRLVYEQEINHGTNLMSVDVATLKQGIFLLEISSQHSVIRKQFAIQR